MIFFLKLLTPLLVCLSSIKVFGNIYISHLLILLTIFYGAIFKGKCIHLNQFFVIIFLINIAYIFSTNIPITNITSLKSSIQILIFIFSILLPLIFYGLENPVKIAIRSIVCGLLVNSIFGIIEAFLWIIDNGPVFIANGVFFRIKGLSVSPSDFVLSSLTGLIFSSAFSNNLRITIFLRIIFTVSILLSMSRVGLLFLPLIYISLFDVEYFSSLIKSNIKKLCFVFLIILIFIFILSPYLNLILIRFFDLFNSAYNIQRLLIFNDVLNKITSTNLFFIFGHGFDQFNYINSVNGETYDNVHNSYLYILYSEGIIGLTLILLLLANVFNIGKGNLLLSPYIYRPYKFCIFLYLIMSLIDTTILSVGSGWLMAYIIGIGLLPKRTI